VCLYNTYETFNVKGVNIALDEKCNSLQIITTNPLQTVSSKFNLDSTASITVSLRLDTYLLALSNHILIYICTLL
jgi:hypothetical protein